MRKSRLLVNTLEDEEQMNIGQCLRLSKLNEEGWDVLVCLIWSSSTLLAHHAKQGRSWESNNVQKRN